MFYPRASRNDLARFASYRTGFVETSQPSQRLLWLRKQLARRAAPLVIVCFVMLLAVPALFVGELADDHVQALVLQGSHALPGYTQPWWQLFRFADPRINKQLMAEGSLPWWTDPQLKISFFRPLSALTHELDHVLWPHSTVLMHAQSLVFLALLLLAASMFYREVFIVRSAAGLALLLYAFDNTRILPIAWLANRNTLIACALSALALALHFRHATSRSARWASPLLFGLGLLASEGAMATLGYLAAAALFLDGAPLRQRWLRLLPYAAVAIAYLCLSRALGYGVAYSGEYLDPLNDLLHYAIAFPGRVFALMGAEVAAAGAELWSAYDIMLPGLSLLIGAYVLAVCVFFGWVLWPLVRRSPSARFFLVGALLALPPSAATSPHGRTLTWVSIGVMGLLAEYITQLDTRKTLQRVMTVVIVTVHLVLSPLTIPGGCKGIADVESRWERADRAVTRFRTPAQRTVVYVNPPQDPMVVFTRAIEAERSAQDPLVQRWLYSGFTPLTLHRIDARTLDVEAHTGFVREPTERLFRGDQHRFQIGQRVELPGFSAQIMALTKDQRPERVRFEFEHSLEDPSYLWLEWRDDDFAPFEAPAIGSYRELPAADFAETMLGPDHPLTRMLASRRGRLPDPSYGRNL